MSHPEIAQLCEADQEVVNALVECSYDIDKLPAAQRERGRRLLDLLALLDTPEPAGHDLLTARTLQLVQRRRQQERFSQQIQALTTPATAGGISVRELVAVAAMLIVGVSVFWPMLANARGVARQVACQSHLAAAGAAINRYGFDHEGHMPATFARLGDPWWETNSFNSDGSARSNSAHLFTLARTGYLPLDLLNCAENPDAIDHVQPGMRDWPSFAAVSFSYQNQYASQKPRLGLTPDIAVLADKNPLFEPGRFRVELADSGSLNHEGGQNVLLSSGEVRWMEEPAYGRDRIFHAGNRGFDYYTGTEGPASVTDSFLVP